MDYFSERIRLHSDIEKHSTELISKSYEDSGLSHHNEPIIDDNADKYYMAEDKCSESEIYNVECGKSKRDTSNDTTAQLSAQIMNLPYSTFNESIPIEAPGSPKKCFYDEYDIFKKIKEAYAACACKICKCLTGMPRVDFCDCEPCKCKDCTSNNLINNSGNCQPCLGNKTYNRKDQIKSEIPDSKCECKPCDCVKCSQHCSLRPDYDVGTTMKEVDTTMAPKSTLARTSPQDPRNDINKFAHCKHITCMNDAYKEQKTIPYRWYAQMEAPRKQTDDGANVFEYYNNKLNIKQHDKKCVCSICECIVCECNGNSLTCSLDTDPYKTFNAQNSGKPNPKLYECQLRSHKNQITSQSENSDCKCDICNCVQRERDGKYENRNCNCDQCHCDVCEGGCKTPGDAPYLLKKQLLISRVKHEKPLSYGYNVNAQLMKFKAQQYLSSTHEKTKYGNIYYVSNNKSYEAKNKILRQVQSITTMTDNNIEIVHKDSDRKVDSKQRQVKCTQVNNAIKTAYRRSISRTPKNSAKNVSASVLPSSRQTSKGVPVNNSGKTRPLHSLNQGCRSTQTTSKSSSSLMSYQNNGCCTHTISLPDANIADDFTETRPEKRVYETRKGNYQKHHDIYLCCELKSGLHKTNASKVVRLEEHSMDGRKYIVENFLSDTFDKYFTKNCDLKRINQVKVDHESVHTTLQNAKKFTVYLNKILQKYEKANSDFESVSDKLKSSHYAMFNEYNNFNFQVCRKVNSLQSVCNERKIDTKPNESILIHNHSCDPFGELVDTIEVKNNQVQESETVDERIEFEKSSHILNQKKEKKTVRILQPDYNNILDNSANQKENVSENNNESQSSVNDLQDESIDRTPCLKSFVANSQHLFQDTTKEHENTTSEAEILRREKILNILKQNVVQDLFIERVLSPISTPTV